MNGDLFGGFEVLGAIARGIDAPEAIASHLSVSTEEALSHIDRLSAAGFVRRDGERVILSVRVTRLLDGLVGRSDLLAIAAPVVLEAEQRLGMRIDVDIVQESDPRAIAGSSPFAVVPTGGSGRDVVAPVLDAADQIACVLRVGVDSLAPESVEAVGRQLAATADAVAELLPKRKDRGPDWQLRI